MGADLVSDDRKKNTSGFVYTLGGIVVSWISNLHKIVALSTTKAKHVVTKDAKDLVIL